MLRRRCLSRAFAASPKSHKAAQTVKTYSASRLNEDFLKTWQTKLQDQFQDNLKNFTFSCKSHIIMQYLRLQGGSAEIARETEDFEKLIMLSWMEQLFDKDELGIKLTQRFQAELKSRKFVSWPVFNRVALAQIMANLKFKHPSWHDRMESAWPSEIERITVLGASHAEMYYCHSALKGVPGIQAELLTTDISKWYQVPITFQARRPSEAVGDKENPEMLLLFQGKVRSKIKTDQPIHSVVFSESEEALAQKDFITNLTLYNNLRLVFEFSKNTGGQTLLVAASESKAPRDGGEGAGSHNPLSIWRPLAQQLVVLATQ